MSAVAGVFSFDDPPYDDSPVLQRLRSVAEPGGYADKRSEPVALFQISRFGCSGPGAFGVADRHCEIVFDGRLDNRRELAAELGVPTGAAGVRSDAEIVVAAYRAWGEASPHRLLGDFAFAIWDKARQRLFCARDPVGARPFHYLLTKRYFAFASDEEALAALAPDPIAPSPEWMAFFLVQSFQDLSLERGLLDGMRSLPPASALEVYPTGRISKYRYWDYSVAPQLDLGSDAEYREAFRAVFLEAVSCRVEEVEKPAACMSGGLDSAALAVALRACLDGEEANGFCAHSVISDDLSACLESRCIRQLAAALGLRARMIGVPSLASGVAVQALKRAAWEHAHPTGNELLVLSLACEAASRAGHSVMLHAPSGDLVQGDPRYLVDLFRQFRWNEARRESKLASKHHTYLQGIEPRRLLLSGIWGAFAPKPLTRTFNRRRRVRSGPPEGAEWLNPDFERELQIKQRIERYWSHFDSLPYGGFRAEHAASIFGPAGVAQGLAAGQGVASRYGIEMRDPWVDLRVIDFYLRLPLDQLVRGGWTKYLARSTLAADLDHWVVWRSDKEHVGWKVVECLMSQSADEVDDFLQCGLSGLGPYVDTEAVRKRFAQGAHSPADRHQLYRLMTLAFWLRRLKGLPGESAAAFNHMPVFTDNAAPSSYRA